MSSIGENGGREKTRVFQIMNFDFFVRKRGFTGGGVNSKICKKGGFLTKSNDRRSRRISKMLTYFKPYKLGCRKNERFL